MSTTCRTSGTIWAGSTRSAATSTPAPPRPGTAAPVSYRSAAPAPRSPHRLTDKATRSRASSSIGTFATVGNVGLSGGAVTGSNYVGALAGENNGSITRSYATGTVTSSGAATNTGGLVGYNSGSIAQSYATGTVTGQNQVGGLAG